MTTQVTYPGTHLYITFGHVQERNRHIHYNTATDIIIAAMRVCHISAVTLKVNDMEKSCKFYSKIPGFKLVCGGSRNEAFATYQIGEGDKKTYLNLELAKGREKLGKRDFGRIIFHTDNVDELYLYMKSDEYISSSAVFESGPADASWGERFFHIREPSGYQLSFAEPL